MAHLVIRKLEQSRIQDSPEVKVVLFKTALTTGWDCPRAEVMMSFRRAQDPTSIAQYRLRPLWIERIAAECILGGRVQQLARWQQLPGG